MFSVPDLTNLNCFLKEVIRVSPPWRYSGQWILLRGRGVFQCVLSRGWWSGWLLMVGVWFFDCGLKRGLGLILAALFQVFWVLGVEGCILFEWTGKSSELGYVTYKEPQERSKWQRVLPQPLSLSHTHPPIIPSCPNMHVHAPSTTSKTNSYSVRKGDTLRNTQKS